MMRMMPGSFNRCVAVLGAMLAWSSVSYAQSGEHIITVSPEQIDSTHWEVLVSLANGDPLAAMTLPLRWGTAKQSSPFRLDSAEYYGLRTQYFALKTFRVDTTRKAVLIGMISDLGSDLPPLEVGSGPIARLHFSTKIPVKTPLVIDTTFFPPHNTLQVVTPDVRSITPMFLRPTRK